MYKFRIPILLPVLLGVLICSGCCPPWSECDPACEVNPARLDFGSVEVGASKDLSFKIKNTAGGTLTGTISLSSSDYVIVSGGGSYDLEADETHTVTVRFTPTSDEAKACKVGTGTGACPDVTCTGYGTLAPSCFISSSSLSFDSVQVGSYEDLSFSVQNAGGGELTGEISEICAGFSVTSGGGNFSLSAGESRGITVRYAPTTTGPATCLVTTGIDSCASVTCTGFGTPGPECLVTADTLVFGSVQIGYRAVLGFDIENIGIDVLTGNVSESCGRFSIESGGGAFALNNGQIHNVLVSFSPTTTTPETCAVYLGTGLCGPVVCVGSGNTGPECRVFPAYVDFGSVMVGYSNDGIFQISNAGTGTLTGSVSEDNNQYSILSGNGDYALGAGQTHTVTMRFTPTVPGQQNCTVETGTGLCADVLCVGQATPPPACRVTPEELDFGDVELYTSVDLWFEIENVGGGILSGTITENCYYYGIAAGAGDFNLSQGETRRVVVRYRPTSTWASSCYVRTGLADCFSVRCSGTGVDP